MEPIRKLIKRAAKSIDQHSGPFAKRERLTRAQMAVLDFLSQQAGQTANQHTLDEEFAIQRSTTTIMLQRLEKRNLIRRLPDPNDKRQKLVQLTAEANKLIPQIREEIKDDDLGLLQQFSKEELATVRKFLEYIAEEG
ncbi:transcriptional regulator [Lactobacillus nasalidis]|uniref:Transcriptional regulator n=1 Tax=Lactobacillus nasalidis TaxID=2797258 RepID=A0ABQ3WCV4_9LACO|nr:MarR family transcriptional regulator [Lactobacillus nasalidis]GHV97945.1 transcriptional regulator [Lactobacillus nasalidis]GHV99663.1 transcriptional regulator [Lactobacillus nasalidis]GHW02047.1 transcriptional regulator [Lactobacillus nasalidis]